MRSITWFLLWLGALLSTPLARVSGSQQDIAKYADSNVAVSSLLDAGGAVIVSSLHVLPNQSLLAIVVARQDQAAALGVKVVGKSAIIGRISKQSGRTWNPAFLVLDSPADGKREAGDPTIAVAGERVIVIASMSGPPQPPFEYGDIKLWQTTSTDNAATWSRPAEIALPRTRLAVSGRVGVALPNGRILIPYWWDFMFQTGAMGMAQIGDIPGVAGTMLSDDSGQTWQLSNDVYGQWSVQPKVLHTADEPAIVALSDKDILMVLRSARADGVAEETWSHDGGQTWQQPKPGPLNEFNTPSGLWRMKNGWVVRLWNNSKTALRFPLAVAISKDNCRTWSNPRTIVNFPAGSKWPTQASYPSVVEAADGALVAVWCHVTPEGRWIWASGRFTAEWALGK
jgi:hypothetical protein